MTEVYRSRNRTCAEQMIRQTEPSKDTGKRFPESALLAAGCKKPFTRLLLSDTNESNLVALEARLLKMPVPPSRWLRTGDANLIVDEIGGQIPDRALSIAFLDPWSLGIRFETIRKLTKDRLVDLLILFPDAIDLIRNIDEYYYSGRSSLLDEAMGDGGQWKLTWDEVRQRNSYDRKRALVEYYIKRLESIDYKCFDASDIKDSGRQLYKIVYASKNDLGLKFWRLATQEDLDGQRRLF